MSRYLLRLDKTVQGFLDELTSSAVTVAEAHGATGEGMRARMEAELKEVIRRELVVSDICGLSAICDEGEFFEPFSEEALELEAE
jgi:hypothetical protein